MKQCSLATIKCTKHFLRFGFRRGTDWHRRLRPLVRNLPSAHVFGRHRAPETLRLDNQELELRDYSNLQKEHETVVASKKDCIYQLATVSGLLKVGSVPLLDAERRIA